MKASVLFLILLFTNIVSFAQNDGEISGIVMDADTQLPLSGASIKFLNKQNSVLTDQNGKFSIDMTHYGSIIKIAISFAGYENDTLTLSSTIRFYNLTLKPARGHLTDVVVSVDGRTLIKENPVAITMIPSKRIDQTLQSNIIDVLVKNVPGLNAVKTGPNISKPFIRGLGYSRVLTLYDGVRQEGQQWGDEHGIEINPYGIEKAEVIKGPVSLIYGSDALAGVVSMTPFMPKDRDGKVHGRLTSEYQQNNALIGNGVGLYSSSLNWYWVTSGSYRMAKNYKNAVDGRVYNTNFKESAAAFTLGHTSTTGQSSINFTLFNDLQGIPDGSRDSLTRKFTKQIYEAESDNISARPVVSSGDLNSYTLSPLHQHIQHYRIYSNNRYKLGIGTIAASLAWQQNIRREYSHPTAIEQPGMYVRLNTVNYGLKYSLPVFANMEWNFGYNGMNQGNKNKDATDFPIPDYRLWDIGAFAFGKWKYNRITISGGIRYDHRSINGDPLFIITNPNTGFEEQTSSNKTEARQQFSAFNKNFSGMSLSLGGTYGLNDHISLKANVARGYRAPNITELASNGLDPGAHIIYIGNMDAKPEFCFQQELGLEIDYPDLSGSISLFNNHISHYIYLTELAGGGSPLVDAQGNKTFQYRQSSAHLYGLEATAIVHPLLWKGFSWTNNMVLTYGVNTNPIYKGKGNQGRYLPFIPPPNWLSNITQVINLKNSRLSSLNVMAELDYHGAQNRYLGLYNTETATPSYALINIAAGASFKYYNHHPINIQLAVNNIFNTVYQSNMSRLKYFEYYSHSPSHYYCSAPLNNRT